MTQKEIGDKLGVSPRTISSWMKQYAIHTRDRSEATKLANPSSWLKGRKLSEGHKSKIRKAMRKDFISKQVLERLYIKEKLSSRQIARKLNVGKTTILSRLNEYGIPTRMSHQGWKLRWRTDEKFRKKLRRIGTENLFKVTGKGTNDRIPWNKGLQRRPETKKKISDKTKGRIPWNKGLTKKDHVGLQRIAEKLSQRTGEQAPNWGGGKRPSKEVLDELYIKEKYFRRQIAEKFDVTETTVDKWLQFYDIKLSREERRRRKALPLPPESRRRQAETMREVVKENREMFLHNLFCTRKPTSIEKEFMAICDEYDFPFKYVGDGKYWIGNPPRNPDFINRRHKLIIETLGEFWHTEEEVKERKQHFCKYGYESLMIWQSELEDEMAVVNKVRRWIGANGIVLQAK